MENDIIVGLAGHIDHGKTSLIRALNGFDGDSLEEEKRRGITLDLSFSNLALPNRNVAFIDVPGHEKLVKNMIAGAFGIDVLCLVVASDDGLMPQSFEHLYIADILGIQSCFCVLSKVDKVDSQTLAKRKNEIESIFKGLNIKLEGIFEFSAFGADSQNLASINSQNTQNTHFQNTESNLQNPQTTISKNTESSALNPYVPLIIDFLSRVKKPTRYDFHMLVYYIDRTFSLSGAGCIVTGTLLSSQIALKQKVFICELEREVSVRQIQIHDAPAELATPSHRVALNLSNISINEIKRGMLITQKGFMRGSKFIDANLRLLKALKNNATYQLYLGAKRVSVRVNMLESLQENEAFIAISSDEEIFSLFFQPFILRDGNALIGGGVVLNPVSDPIKKKDKIPLLHTLQKRDFKSAFAMLCKIHKRGFGLVCATQRFCLTHAQASAIAQELEQSFFDPKELVIYPLSELESLKTEILEIFLKNKNALVSAQSLGLKFRWASVLLLQNALDSLFEAHLITKKDSLYLAKNNEIRDIDEFLEQKIYERFCAQKFEPIAPYNLYEELDIDRFMGDKALKSLCKAQKMVRLSHNLFITSTALSELNALMREIIKAHGYIDITLFKQKLPLSRKYLISYLEYLDSFKDIYKESNARKLRF
ncbi:selenocysteine-specific translation elongation factor [Helicobacter himalayensis]|uniref:selenocysteine-specific translation elongation factor n=1 Tax=Helicobacter himalayensis TaxID=1591088 RepID=UPI00082C7B38|nr:selenocysteine-specific translation elongation factor [Helicobacter himalayensis]